MNKPVSGLAIFFVAGVAALAQGRQSSFTANITGGGGDGKCTIEVNVDGVAMVEINGDRGRLITVSGQPATWRRFQCNQRMPSRPNNFRFSGVDGRGRQNLERDPGNNGGVAVIRIEDSQGGREGYTFDLTWQGGSDNGRGGYGDRPYTDRGNNDRDRDRGGYNGDRRSGNAYTVTCSSDDGRRHYCDVNTRGDVRLLRQRSDSACREGQTWGSDRRGIWVDRGCRADFEVRP